MDNVTKSILLIDRLARQVQILAENEEQSRKGELGKLVKLLRDIRIILQQESLRRNSSGKHVLSAETKAGILIIISKIVELSEKLSD